LQQPSRCPRCGYPMRYDGRGYRCDFCGFAQNKAPISDALRNFERSFREKMQAFMNKGRVSQYERWTVQYPIAGTQTTCASCGLIIPYGANSCPYCSATQTLSRLIPQPITTQSTVNPNDQQVLDYIVARNGTISLSQAAMDLSMSPDALKSTIERLKTAGLLRPSS